MEERRRISDSKVESLHLVRMTHLNGAGRLFGGMLMQWIDEVAALTAKRHAHKNVTTASVDNLRFLKGAYQNDVIIITGKITYVGRTSMEVQADTYIEDLEERRTHINQAFFTMVALDENDRPAPVPGLILETEEERAAWEQAALRRQMRGHKK